MLRDRTVSLNCSTDANPDARTYHWYLNGNLTGNSNSGVFNITVKEDGEYTCVPEKWALEAMRVLASLLLVSFISNSALYYAVNIKIQPHPTTPSRATQGLGI